jgi:uncharacterized membrane protein YhaH (DUF805 family)
MAIAGGLVWLALLLPNLSVAVRRLHDRGLAGWWVLLMLIPVIGRVTNADRAHPRRPNLSRNAWA